MSYNRPEREIIKETKFYEGLYVGKFIRKVKSYSEKEERLVDTNQEFFRYQFKGCLKGDNRHLDVWIPMQTTEKILKEGNCFIEESMEIKTDGKRTMLFLCQDYDELLTKEQIESLPQLRALCAVNEYPTVVQIIPGYMSGSHLGYLYNGTLYSTWSKEENVSTNREYRNRIKYIVVAARCVAPVVSVPLDIITFPFLAGTYIYGLFHGW